MSAGGQRTGAPVRIDSGPSLSQAVVRGGTAYLSGQVALDGSTGIADQTRAVLHAIDARLAEVGSDRSRLLSATIWLADIADFAAMDEVWRAWLDGAPPPARATGQVTLARPDWRVEIIATAAVED
jgi:enamine deaminase RidA (YjgF/YER057c/UK114 family)